MVCVCVLGGGGGGVLLWLSLLCRIADFNVTVFNAHTPRGIVPSYPMRLRER